MRLAKQRDVMMDAIDVAGCELIGMRSAILRKIAAPYGDGSKSVMVNATTDVLPKLARILDVLDAAMQATNDEVFVFGTRGIESNEVAEAYAKSFGE